MRALVVEDDRRIAADLGRAPVSAGFRVEHVQEAETAWFRGGIESYDLIVLDLGLPRRDGLTVLKRWRAEGIDSGADDYLPKPFRMEGLNARARALVRRSVGRAASIQQGGQLSVDLNRMSVSVAGVPVAVTPLEYRLLAFLALLLVAGSALQIRIGLSPLAQVVDRVQALSQGQRSRMGANLPDEMLPLSRQLDALLDARDAELLRARHREGDLAHGFKTPLQALLGDAGTARRRGEPEIAGSIETVVTAMRRLVDRELARARIDPDDLTEALGALLENAMQHADAVVETIVVRQGDRVIIAICDDGPGVPEGALTRLPQRGLRLDESGEGQGIGLAIVRDITDAAGGDLTLTNTRPGLCVELTLAAASPRR